MSVLDAVYGSAPPFPTIFSGGVVTDNYLLVPPNATSIFNLEAQQIAAQNSTPEGSV
jgi:hypothetical protein